MTLTEQRKGLAAGVASFGLWAVFPLYIYAVGQVPTFEILSNRITLSAVLVVALVLALRQGPALAQALRSRRLLLGLLASTVCVSLNWGVYVWAIPHGHAIDVGFGYLVNPLVTVVLGILVLHERLSRGRIAAIAMAAIGVSVLAYTRGGVPWIVLILPVSFGLYGLIRKMVAVDALVGLGVEVLLLAPFTTVYLATRPGGGALLGQGLGMTGMMLLAAPATAAPLFLFAYAARRMPMSTLALLQYVSPTAQLILATAVFGERFTWGHGIAFGLIWAGIAIDWLTGRTGAARAAVDNRAAPGHMAERAASD